MLPPSLAGLLLTAPIPVPGSDADGVLWIDLVGLGLIALFLVLGALRGLWWQVVRLLGIVATVALARAIAPRFSPILADAVPGLGSLPANGITWLFILLIGLIAVAIVGRLGRATLQAAQLGAFDRVGGAVAGAISGCLVHVAFLLVLCQLAPSTWKGSRVEGTQSQVLLETLERSFPRLLDAHAAESVPGLKANARVR
jgi:membrane protein required for colicin V production